MWTRAGFQRSVGWQAQAGSGILVRLSPALGAAQRHSVLSAMRIFVLAVTLRDRKPCQYGHRADVQAAMTGIGCNMGSEHTSKGVKPGSELAAGFDRVPQRHPGAWRCQRLVNILYLTGSIYMLEVYDRVLPSRSVPTLVGLSILVLPLCLSGFLDLLRGRVLVRIGRSLGRA